VESITFEKNSKLSRVEDRAFSCSDPASIQIPASVEVICEFCFSNCKNLESIAFEANSKLSRIEEHVFYNSGLTSIQIPANVEVIDEYCFSYCESLESVTFEEGSKLSTEKKNDLLRQILRSKGGNDVRNVVIAISTQSGAVIRRCLRITVLCL
jgi:hypothetical protein